MTNDTQTDKLYAKDLLSAKQLAIRVLGLNQKQSRLMAIAPAYDDKDDSIFMGWIALYSGEKIEIYKDGN